MNKTDSRRSTDEITTYHKNYIVTNKDLCLLLVNEVLTIVMNHENKIIKKPNHKC